MMRKTFITLSLFAIAFVATSAHAQEFIPLAPIPGLTTGITADQAGLANFLNNLYKYLIGLAAVIAVVEIIWGGLLYSTQDVPGSKTNGKEKIQNALLGLVLVLSPVLVFSIINPSILNLSINLPELDTKSGAPNQTGGTGGTGTQTVDATTNCTVTGTIGILQIATCPTESASKTWGATCTWGNLSSIEPLTISAGGAVAQNTISCSNKNSYVFIETIGVVSFSKAINTLRPLAQTVDNSENASSAISFANICNAAGRKTCISDIPKVTFSVECLPKPMTQIPASSGGSGKCYKETLTCENVSGNTKCVATPDWTPFQ